MGVISELIGYPLGFIMWAIYQVFKNYGVAIFLFTVVTRLVMFPLSVKQQKSSAAMAAFSPKLERLKKQYANNPQKLQEEQMKLYAEEDINPMASCGTLIPQMLFLYGIFDVVYRPLTHILHISKAEVTALKEIAAPLFEGNRYFETRPEIYILQAVQENEALFAGANGVTTEILDKIAAFDNKLFGLVDLGAVPNSLFNDGTVWNAAAISLMLIPVLSGVIQLIMTFYTTAKQKKLNPEASSQMAGMNAMFYLMPIMSVWMAFSFPAGIGYYWICSSLVGFAQSIILNKIYTPEYVAKLIEKDKQKNKNKKKSGFMQKYNELLQEQMKQQNASSGNNGKIATTGVVKDEETGEEIKLSKSQLKEYERKIIAEARRRQAEKYGDEYIDDDKD
ncbi:MAG: YidC/Oxa1 family membrane protein insertase [Oscillospiraceae bacterium]|nr:YidC/Oxa1 family membrane protein insertase [Oscillospiraceae bacterium]